VIGWATKDTPKLNILDLSSLKFDSFTELQDTRNIAIKIKGYTRPVYIGAWCYTEKKRYSSRSYTDSVISNYHQIKQSSLTSGRVKFVNRVLIWLVSMKEMGRSPRTIKTNFGQFVFFLIWCDEQHQDFLSSDNRVVDGYEQYSEHLIDRYSSNQLSINSASTYQGVVRDALCVILGEDNVAEIQSMNKIYRSPKRAKLVKPPNRKIAGQNIILLYTVFDELTKFLLDFAAFPIKLNLNHDTFCMFPIKDTVFTPVSSGVGFNKTEKYKTYIGFNFSEGRLSTYDEVFDLLTMQWKKQVTPFVVKQVIHKASEKLYKANTQKDHNIRLRLANMAMSCFTMMFIAATGMNLAQVSDIKMSDLTRDLDGFINFEQYKARAGDKHVEYYLGFKYSKIFDRYLELRKSVIEIFKLGEVERIFFRAGYGQHKNIDMSFSVSLAEDIRLWYKFDCIVRAKEWRAFKGFNLFKKYGPVKAANVLQNRVSTTLKNYSDPDEENAKVNLTKFFESFSDLLIADQKDQLERIAVGRCLSTGNPSLLSEGTVATPNCKNHEGCLFCANYRVHADGEDLFKLLSYQYIISETRYLQKHNSDEYGRYDAIIARINFILEKIKNSGKVSQHDIQRVSHDVKLGHLSPYWQNKMALLIDLDVA